jgi:thiol-disulfide isomerase/thioredoxin
METISSTFLRPKIVNADELKAHKANLEALKAQGVTDNLPEGPSTFDEIDAKDLQAPYYVAVLFTAEYCPPCQQFTPVFESFIEQMNKESNRMQVVVVNCDKNKAEFDEHLSKMSPKYLVVPFDNEDAAIRLEDKA